MFITILQWPHRSKMERRRYLGGLASASLIIPLAGCGETEEAEPNESPDGDETPTEEDEPEESPDEDGSSTEENSTTDEGADAEAEFVDEVDRQVQLTYGETATLSNGVETTVHDVEIDEGTDNYPPEERDAFALVEVESFNGSDGQTPILSDTDPGIYLLYEDQQVDNTFNYGLFDEIDKDPYEVNDEVQSGVRREGYLLFEVGAGLTEADVDFLWQDQLFVAAGLGGEIDVRWSAE